MASLEQKFWTRSGARNHVIVRMRFGLSEIGVVPHIRTYKVDFGKPRGENHSVRRVGICIHDELSEETDFRISERRNRSSPIFPRVLVGCTTYKISIRMMWKCGEPKT
jgi:hypothetical protein